MSKKIENWELSHLAEKTIKPSVKRAVRSNEKINSEIERLANRSPIVEIDKMKSQVVNTTFFGTYLMLEEVLHIICDSEVLWGQ